MSRWLKFSKEPISGPFERRAQKLTSSPYEKPNGFWFTDESEDNWERWCKAEEYFLEGLRCVHEVILDESNILFLRSASEIFTFTRDFAIVKPWHYATTSGLDHIIDWPLVAERFSGIIITPYQWECRLDVPETRWYYSWDCASGCVWDPQAILSVNLMETVE